VTAGAPHGGVALLLIAGLALFRRRRRDGN
jgi:MYXO-CTERM domain-containing protein